MGKGVKGSGEFLGIGQVSSEQNQLLALEVCSTVCARR